MNSTNHKQNRFVTLLIIIIILVGVVVIASDWKDMRQVLVRADWRYIPVVLFFTFISYTCYSYAYAYVSDLLCIQMGKRELAEVCFISTVVNHVLTTGGVVGYSLRYLLMKAYHVSFKDVLTSSFLHYYLTSLDMLSFLPLTYVYLLLHASVPRGVAVALGLVALFFGLVLILTTGIVLFPSQRRPVIDFLAHLSSKILRRDNSIWLNQFDEALTRGTQAIRQRPLLLLWILLLTLVDFAASITAMGFVFIALGPSVSTPSLVTGYVMGIMAGLISMVPGGWGIQEGSMAGIYSLLGVHFEQAVLAAVLFRILYYLLPYLLVLPFSNRLLRKAGQQVIIES